MKMFFQAIGMAVILFFYGYLLSTAGHDHASHSTQNHMEEESGHSHNGHAH